MPNWENPAPVLQPSGRFLRNLAIHESTPKRASARRHKGFRARLEPQELPHVGNGQHAGFSCDLRANQSWKSLWTHGGSPIVYRIWKNRQRMTTSIWNTNNNHICPLSNIRGVNQIWSFRRKNHLISYNHKYAKQKHPMCHKGPLHLSISVLPFSSDQPQFPPAPTTGAAKMRRFQSCFSTLQGPRGHLAALKIHDF